MDNQHIARLILKELKGEVNSADAEVLRTWRSQSPANEKLYQELTRQDTLQSEVISFYQFRKNILEKIKVALPVKNVIPLWKKLTAAASVILLLSTGAYFLFLNKEQEQITKTESQQIKNDIAPGGNKAILTLANGQQIILDSAANGSLAQQGNTKIIKLDDGQLSYNTQSANGEVIYNTISTPKGGEYQVILSDGSKVWLNAASSLLFPAAFSKERNVQLTGEGYFEIRHNAAKAFNVSVNGMNVQVLGTHFNINAYTDENLMRTTLLEGSVKVFKNGIGKIIKPGEQAIIQSQGKDDIKVQKVDVKSVTAWQRGLFELGNTELPAIMRQISRWYDVEIVYEGKPGNEKFGGGISKNLPLSNVLKLLEANGVQFRLEGKVLTVKP